jgi:NAD(P)-dependent dehydrogenase (short-subunit alcohol dehydrogenase family)
MPKSVFITGAAAGIGRETALAFAARGYTVGAYDIDDTALAALATQIQTAGGIVLTGHLDVTDYDEVSLRAGEFASACGNRLDVLVNNAGILFAGAFEGIGVAADHKVIDVNCKGVVNGLHAAFPYLRDTPQAVVVNLASASAIYGQAELAVYSSTKFFVRGLTEALDLEWAHHDIRVISIWPPFVRSAMTDDMDIASVRTLGIHLDPRDVAAAIITAVESADGSVKNRILHPVHYPVGRLTRTFAGVSRFVPGWLVRRLNKRITRS